MRHLYADEIAGNLADIEVRFTPGVASVTDVEFFTNLNRRHLAKGDENGDGERDAILLVKWQVALKHGSGMRAFPRMISSTPEPP